MSRAASLIKFRWKWQPLPRCSTQLLAIPSPVQVCTRMLIRDSMPLFASTARYGSTITTPVSTTSASSVPLSTFVTQSSKSAMQANAPDVSTTSRHIRLAHSISAVTTPTASGGGRKKPVPMKDPERPKRPATAWIGFLKDYRSIDAPAAKLTSNAEIFKGASIKWKALPAQDRRRWVEPYEAAKRDYDVRYKQYVDSGKHAAWKRDPEKPVQPLSGYMRFAKEVRPKYAHLKITEQSKEFGAAWKNLPAEKKAPYDQAYATDKEKYDKALKLYKDSGKQGAWELKTGITAQKAKKLTAAEKEKARKNEMKAKDKAKQASAKLKEKAQKEKEKLRVAKAKDQIKMAKQKATVSKEKERLAKEKVKLKAAADKEKERVKMKAAKERVKMKTAKEKEKTAKEKLRASTAAKKAKAILTKKAASIHTSARAVSKKVVAVATTSANAAAKKVAQEKATPTK